MIVETTDYLWKALNEYLKNALEKKEFQINFDNFINVY